jgi:hypothetical protein
VSKFFKASKHWATQYVNTSNKQIKTIMKTLILTILMAAPLIPALAQQDTSKRTYDSTTVHKRTYTDSTHVNKPVPNNNNQNKPAPNNNTTTKAPNNDQQPAAKASPEYSKWYLGVRFLPTLTDLSFSKPQNGVIESSTVLGYGFGGLVGVNFSDHAGLQAELLFNSLAQQYKEGNATGVVHLNYINVPLLLVLNTGYSQQVNFNVAFGPQFGYNTGSSVSGGAGPYGDTVKTIVAVKPADIGFAYGLGLDIKLGSSSRTKLSFGYRGVFGVVDISDNSNNQTTNSYYILQRSFVKTYAAYVGLTFGL